LADFFLSFNVSQQLKEKGLLEDMHVYGDAWANDPEEVELSNPEFGDLQSVIGKVRHCLDNMHVDQVVCS